MSVDSCAKLEAVTDLSSVSRRLLGPFQTSTIAIHKGTMNLNKASLTFGTTLVEGGRIQTCDLRVKINGRIGAIP